MIIHNQTIGQLIRENYSLSDIQAINSLLEQQNTLSFPILDNGLFPAAELISDTEYTGYSNVWIRDNIYLAYAHYFCGQKNIAINTVNTLMKYFNKHQLKFVNIIKGKVDKNEIMKRPHIRFHGETLDEIAQEWGHAQNDALGYFVWFYSKLVREEIITPNANQLKIIGLIIVYFKAIKYWQDEDSGHWEEDPKIEASSIGVVVAALTEIKQLLKEKLSADDLMYETELITVNFLDKLIKK
ncbi:MAG: glycoside hydrolase family 15 protein [Crocosphaera sp.]|nr:glycoside hydrolase family 15 protein [Crocosphaera sp.]